MDKEFLCKYNVHLNIITTPNPAENDSISRVRKNKINVSFCLILYNLWNFFTLNIYHRVRREFIQYYTSWYS